MKISKLFSEMMTYFGSLDEGEQTCDTYKAVLVMGHIGSERAGMMYLAEIIKEKHSELPVRYIECGEVYSYTD